MLTGAARLALCLLCILSLAVATRSEPDTFHVQGRIVTAWDSLLHGEAVPKSKLIFDGHQKLETITTDQKDSYVRLPRSEVTFTGAQINESVVVDKDGYYQADLPLGEYRMVARGPQIGPQSLREYVRVFRVLSRRSVLLNGELYLAKTTCDANLGADVSKHVWEDTCGGQDSFAVPSDAFTLELSVSYLTRRRTGTLYSYDNSMFPELEGPVFAAYNLFSLEAEKVSFDTRTSILKASGNVMVDTASGEKTKSSDNATFKLQDGRAIPLK